MGVLLSTQPKTRVSLETLLWLMENAYGEDSAYALLANLRDLRESDWAALPPGGGRTIADILEHVARSKWRYWECAFGSASLQGEQPPLVPADGARSRSREDLLAWLAEGQLKLVDAIRGLADDAALERPTLTPWGAHLPLKIIIRILIAHDLYHAGEINHLRAILQGNDHFSE